MSGHHDSAPLVVRPVVLLVQRKPMLAEWVLQTMRTDSDVRFHHHSEATGAVARALEVEPTVILQDLAMKGGSGYELIAQYRATHALSKVPVIALVAAHDDDQVALAFQAGATDYVVRAPHPVELMPRIRAYSAVYVLEQERQRLLLGLQKTEQQLNDSRAQLAKVATADPVTGVANAQLFEATLTREWRRAARDPQPLSLALIEIDFFRQYERRYGGEMTEQCVRKVAETVAAHARRPADLAARNAADHFALLLPQTPAEGARTVASQVCAAIAGLGVPHGAREDAHRIVTASLGVVTLLPSPSQPMLLLPAAERALERARLRGRDAVVHGSLDAD